MQIGYPMQMHAVLLERGKHVMLFNDDCNGIGG
jgi:hypothetical protein